MNHGESFPAIDYDAINPKSRLYYPFVNMLSIPLDDKEQRSELVTVSGLHFMGTTNSPGSENWQFPIFHDLLQYVAELPADLPTTAFNEGARRQVDLDDTIEAALLKEGDPGMFTWMMETHGIPVESWDLSTVGEIRKLLSLYNEKNNHPLSEVLRSSWPSLLEFKRWVGYFEVGKYAAQYLRLRAEKPDLGSFHSYVYPRLKSQGVISEFNELDIDISPESRLSVHTEACAGLGIDLPFDPSDAVSGLHTPDQYFGIHFPPTNISTEGYFMQYPRSRRLGGITGRILRNDHLAELLIDKLSSPKRVIIAVGGRHVGDSLSIMDQQMERKLPPVRSIIGELACRQHIGLNYGRFGTSHLEDYPYAKLA